MSDEEKLVSHYQLKTLLRRDGFGAVYAAEDTRDQKAVILRVIELDHQALIRITGRVRSRSQRDHPLIEQIRQRMKRISELKHSHILPVIEFGEEHIQENNDIIFYMVSPFERASLLSYWTERYSSVELISLEIVADLLVQAAEALRYVHKHGLVHQYIRLSSFMLRSSARARKHPHLLLTDFWFADITTGILEEGQISQDLSVYLASEQLAGKAVAASDQYALAILAYELLLGSRLSQVDLSVGFYERFVRQRSAEVSEEDLELARQIDLVLARALAEDASLRFASIDAFAYAFRSVSRRETVDLGDEDTIKLPPSAKRESTTEVVEVAGALAAEGIVEAVDLGDEDTMKLPPGARRKSVTEVEAVAGALAAEEIVEEVTETTESDSVAGMLAAAEIEAETQTGRGRGLHKTVLTSEGMDIAEEETLTELSETTIVEQESTQSSTVAAAGFIAGLAAGELIGQAMARKEEDKESRDIALEQTLIMEGAAATLFAESRDIALEQTLIMQSTEAATLAASAEALIAGEVLASEEEASKVTGTSGAGAGLAGGMVVGEVLASEEASEVTKTSGVGAGLAGLAGGIGEREVLASEVETSEVTGTGTSGTGIAGVGLAGLAGGVVAGEVLASEVEASQLGGTGVTGAGVGGAGVTGTGITDTGITDTGVTGTGITGTGVTGTGVTGTGVTNTGVTGTGVTSTGVGGAGVTGAGWTGLAGTGFGGGNASDVEVESIEVPALGLATTGLGTSMSGLTGVGNVGRGRGRGRRRRRWLIAALLAIVLLLLFAGISAFAQNFSQSSATVTLTLESHTIQNTYVLTASPDTAITTQSQVQARQLSQVVSQSKTGQASGYFAGTRATGSITFKNNSMGCGCPVDIPAGTSFTDAHGIQVVTDVAASVASGCTDTVSAHAVVYGVSGNIPANDIQANYSSTITASNPSAFTGGQNGQSNSVIQQSDIDSLATPLQTQTIKIAQTNLQSQVKTNEKLLATPVCQSQTTSSQAAGDIASSVTVTVTTTCTAEVYDYTGAIQTVQQQVQKQASTYFSSDFVLQGNLQTQVVSATLVDTKVGKILLEINALGKWAYHLDNSQKQSLQRIIAGRSVSDARSLLASQQGISHVQIAVSGFDQSKLPSDPARISIILKD
jgi:serine/threonine protein kinase